MRDVIALACIANYKILLVKKNKTWILPGGKPKKGESHEDCLFREIGEELPKSDVVIYRFYDAFTGLAPHAGDLVRVHVYLGSIDSDLQTAAEISDAKVVSFSEANYMQLSEATRQVLNRLTEDGRL